MSWQLVLVFQLNRVVGASLPRCYTVVFQPKRSVRTFLHQLSPALAVWLRAVCECVHFLYRSPINLSMFETTRTAALEITARSRKMYFIVRTSKTLTCRHVARVDLSMAFRYDTSVVVRRRSCVDWDWSQKWPLPKRDCK